MKSAKNEKEYQNILFDLGYNNPPFSFRQSDIILQMHEIIAKKHQFADWAMYWRHLVHLAKIQNDFTDSLKKFALKQAEQYPELNEQMVQLTHQLEHGYDKKQREYERQQDEARKLKRQEIQNSYENIASELEIGEHLSGLSNIAKAYLGRYSDLTEFSDPEDRVLNLVGSKIAPMAFAGLNAAMQRDDIPTARQITELQANEQKTFFFEHILIAYCAMVLRSGKSLSDIPLEILRSTLAACHWDLDFRDDLTFELQTQLEEIVFARKESKESFIRDTIEPYLNAGTSHVLGLWGIVRKEKFSDIAGPLAIEWLKKYAQLSNDSLRDLLIAAISYNCGPELVALIRDKVYKNTWNDKEQRGTWIGTAFLVDFEHHINVLTAYADEGKEHLWPLRDMAFPDRANTEYWPKLDEEQNHFIIIKFGTLWTPEPLSSDGIVGDRNAWQAYQFIQERIRDLSANLSDRAEILLKGMINTKRLDGYQDYIKHVYAQQTRSRAEESKKVPSLSEVRNILLKDEPVNHDDLQALLIDELTELQDRIRNSPTNEILPFWNSDNPHEENYCRDRIASGLTPYLDRFSVRVHTEGTMPDSNRCDLLCTHKMKDVPIEIKGQWHPDIWKAASNQLLDYSKEYRAKGRGIYLVLWFGYLGLKHPKNPRGWKNQPYPKTLSEIEVLLSKKYDGISEKTKIFVLNVSRPI